MPSFLRTAGPRARFSGRSRERGQKVQLVESYSGARLGQAHVGLYQHAGHLNFLRPRYTARMSNASRSRASTVYGFHRETGRVIVAFRLLFGVRARFLDPACRFQPTLGSRPWARAGGRPS